MATTLLLALVSFLQLYDTTPIKKGKEGGSWGEKVSRLLWRVLYQTPGYASRTPAQRTPLHALHHDCVTKKQENGKGAHERL